LTTSKETHELVDLEGILITTGCNLKISEEHSWGVQGLSNSGADGEQYEAVEFFPM